MKEKQFFDGFSRMQVLQLYACGKCGECISACPIVDETQNKELSPAYRIRALKQLAKARYGLKSLLLGQRNVDPKEVQKLVEALYHGCTVCGRCMTLCPFKFDLINIWEKARERAVESGFGPASALQIEDAVKAEKNVYKMPHSSRRDWLEYEGVEVPKKENADTLFFVGCTTSYSGILMTVAHAVTSILSAAGENWMLLDDEWCCGSPLKFAGTTKMYTELVTKNINAIEATNAKQVVFNCPSCYKRFKEEYPVVIGRQLKFRVIHIVELIDEYIREGRITPIKELDETVSYHDPCELSRLLGVIDEPRRVLSQFASKFVEMPENKVNARCCGAGGMFKAIDADVSLNLAKKRLEQAEKLGVTILTSACPACKLNLDEASFQKDSKIKVLDITEFVAQQLGLMEI